MANRGGKRNGGPRPMSSFIKGHQSGKPRTQFPRPLHTVVLLSKVVRCVSVCVCVTARLGRWLVNGPQWGELGAVPAPHDEGSRAESADAMDACIGCILPAPSHFGPTQLFAPAAGAGTSPFNRARVRWRWRDMCQYRCWSFSCIVLWKAAQMRSQTLVAYGVGAAHLFGMLVLGVREGQRNN